MLLWNQYGCFGTHSTSVNTPFVMSPTHNDFEVNRGAANTGCEITFLCCQHNRPIQCLLHRNPLRFVDAQQQFLVFLEKSLIVKWDTFS